MRNKIAGRQLSRDSAHRQALYRNMVEALVTHERIRTTVAKAKELRRFADNVVTWAKVGGSTYETKLSGFLRTPESVEKVKNVLKPRYRLVEGTFSCALMQVLCCTHHRMPHFFPPTHTLFPQTLPV